MNLLTMKAFFLKRERNHASEIYIDDLLDKEISLFF
jgi:hypothetical protein